MVAGHLRKQNGIYQIILNYKESGGKRKTKSISTGLPVKGNARKAEQMLQKVRQEFSLSVFIQSDESMSEINISEVTESSKILFSDFLYNWLELMKNSVDVTTYAGYYYSIKNCVMPYFKAKGYTLKDIEDHPNYIQDYYTYEMDVRGVTANTVIHRHANIRKALQYAFQIGLINSNPADRIMRPKKNTFVAEIYTGKEIEDLFQVFKGDPLELIVMFTCFYGFRRSEIAGLKWSAIDFDRKTITIRHTVTEVTIDGKYITVAKDRTKTKSSFRTLPLVGEFEDALHKLREVQERNQKICGDAYCKKYLDYIFVNAVGELVKPGFITQHFPMILQKNNMKKIRFHDLRHSCASLLYANGVSLKEIQEWLGHSDIAT